MNEPFLRPVVPEGAAPTPCPPGHEAEPAGVWHGRAMEVIYDPRRHDVAFLRGNVSAKVLDGLDSTGWEYQLSDGPNQMWTRDRMAVARGRLERISAPAPAARIA